jgi:hypothetical protein
MTDKNHAQIAISKENNLFIYTNIINKDDDRC